MKKIIFASVILFFVLLTDKEVSAQQKDSVKKEHAAYYGRILSITQDQAKQVAEVQDEYKSGVKAILAEPGLSEEVKRLRIDALIAAKNKRLSALLTPVQLIKVVPSTELENKKTAGITQPKKD